MPIEVFECERGSGMSLTAVRFEYERRQLEKKVKRAVILLSGGLDSTVSAYQARQDIGRKGELYALSFDYGQRHVKEIRCAQTTVEKLKCRDWKVLELPLHEIVKTALTGNSDIPQGGVKEGVIPSTWVPQRNSIFLALAAAYLETVDADFIYTGFNVLDSSGYPDTRPQFVSAINKALELASKRFVETGRGFAIITPLINLSKADIVRLGVKLGVPFEDCWSCYVGEDKACGKCDSCVLRLRGFAQAEIVDPIEYEQDGCSDCLGESGLLTCPQSEEEIKGCLWPKRYGS
jgi:7-cyano-7-deazaguanine synthase